MNKQTLELLAEERKYSDDVVTEEYRITKNVQDILYYFWENNKEEISKYVSRTDEEIDIVLEYIIREYDRLISEKKI